MKPTILRKILPALGLLFSCLGFSQEFNSFDIRYQDNIKGDLTFIANGIVNRDGGDSATEPEDAYNTTGTSSNYNDYLNMQYIDVDSDASTFSSSSASFTFPDLNCNLIRYAGLYWSATYPSEQAGQAVGTNRQNDFNQIKFRVPGGAYVDITADEIIYDGFTSALTSVRENSPYACYADVTALLTALPDPTGTYTVANIRSVVGSLSPGGGASAGWTLVVVYENPTLTGKLITTFDGFARVRTEDPTVDINYSGFNTIPAGPVRANIGVAALEGDNRIVGDRLRIRAASSATFTTISNTVNPADNFFNSNITLGGTVTTNRTPNSVNTLGYDTDIFLLNNPLNNVIPNNETAATFRFTSSGDQYYPFFNSFNIEIIEPNIVLEKRVEDIAGNDITGAGVNLGQLLDYVLTFENIGNDDATSYTIRDVLPVNTTLIPGNMVLPPGVTYVFDSVNNEVTFTIPDNLIEEGDPAYSIRMRVQVAENCFDFVDACTDLIQNLAYSSYQGVINDNPITDDPSVTDFDACGFTTPGATNFLLDDLENCDFTRTVEMCGANVLLEAGENFDSYIWYRDVNGNNAIDPGDTVLNDGDPDNDPSTLLVTQVGDYIVDKIVADPCKGFQEFITVTLFGTTQTNPIVDLINDPTNTVEGEVVTCPNDGELLPKIFLCGINDTELIQINIPDATSIQWQQLDEASCADAGEDCANKTSSCTWNNVGTGSNWLAETPGEYRIQINYQNGCFTRFYFNIFQNPLDPQYNATDIICTTPGNITVTNLPATYEYQLLNAVDGNILVPFSANNGPSFDIANNGAYTVEIRQQGVTDGCIFRLEDIGILARDMDVEITADDADCNGLGAISISALNVGPQYYFEVSQGGTVVDTHGPGLDNNYTFENLGPGLYDVTTTTDDGCTDIQQLNIEDNSDLAVTAVATKPIDCTDGIITVTATGGFPNPDYSYAIWSYNGTDLYPSVGAIPAGNYQDTSEFYFTPAEAGSYEFIAVDANNCWVVSNVVDIEVAPAVVYSTTISDETCFGVEDGSVSVTISNYNGYSVLFTLTYPDASTATNTSGNFTDLPQGAYTLTLTQTNGPDSCDFEETFAIGGPVDAVEADVALILPYTCLQTGSIQAQNVVGGAAPYEYSIDGISFQPSDTFTGLTAGNYTITVRDDSGCTAVTDPINIPPLDPPTDITFSATPITCPALVSDLTLTAVGGTGAITYEMIAPAAVNNGTSNVFTALAPDTYTFRITDANGCSYDENYTLLPISPIQISGSLVADVSCVGGTDGAVDFAVNGFASTYSYTLNGGAAVTGQTASLINLTGLAAGAYTLEVTDETTNCTDTDTITVSEPASALGVSLATTAISCTDDGSVQVTASGGWGSYSYQLELPDASILGPQANNFFSGLTQDGTYTVTVLDSNGCEITDTFTFAPVVAPELEVLPNSPCYNDAVGLTLTANIISGGDGNYRYRINGGSYDTNNTFAGLNPGTYLIEVIDGNNCTDSESITIDPELSITAAASPIAACGANTNVTISAAGGDGNYAYALVPSGATPTGGDFGASNVISVSGAGTYDAYVRDNNGNAGFCEATTPITIVQDAPLAVLVSNTPILCSGENQATISITASGGAPPYQYSINNGATFQVSNTFHNLGAGNYPIRVRDANNCIVNQTHSITEPLELSASAAVTQLAECNPGLGAEVRITNAIGGTPPYAYSFNGGVSYVPSPIGYLLEGNHTLYIQDANGCTFPMDVSVAPAPTPPNVSHAITYGCDGEGNITLTPDSADFDYTYSLDGTPNTPPTSNVFADVPVGAHTITVDYISNIAPPASTLLLETFGSGANTAIPEVDPAYCYEPQDGTVNSCGWGIDTHIQDGEYSVTQNIVNPYGTWLSPNDHSGLANGRFLAMNVGGVVGPNGIIYAKRGIEVMPGRDITISLWAFNLLRNGTGGADPDINIQLVDGSGTVIQSTTTGNVPKNNGVNDWQNYTVTLNPGGNTNLDIVIRTNSAVTGGNDIAIDDIEAFQIPEVCSASLAVDVYVEDGYAFEAAVTSFSNLLCNGAADGTITFEVENFDLVNGFEYAVNGGAFSAPQTASPVTVTGLSAGANTIEVRDVLDNSCTITLVQNLTEPAPVVAAATISQPATCTNPGATITASGSGGTPTYQYQLEDAIGGVLVAYQASNTFNALAPGDYVVRVRDINNCEDAIDTPITVDPPQTIVFTATPTACYSGDNDATIQVDVTDGNGGYQFRINSGAWFTPTPASATTYTFGSLTAGTYAIEVRDQFGCVAAPQNITINPELTASAILTTDLSCIAPAAITINAAGGSGSYSYEWSDDGGSTFNISGFAANVFSTNAAGTYVFRVTDTTTPAACTVLTQSVVINPTETPVISSITPTDILCNGEMTGMLDVVIDTSVGSAPYTIEVIETISATNYGTQTTGLPAGSYEVTVTDSKGCVSVPFPVAISQPDAIAYNINLTPITCNPSTGTDPGSIAVENLTGGTAEYTYYLTGNNGYSATYTTTSGGENHTFTILEFGIYEVDVVDANGCSLQTTNIIASPPDDLDIDVSTATASCAAGGTAIVEVSSAVGSGDYLFAILDSYSIPYASTYQAPDVPGGDISTFTGLIPGVTYTFVVHDQLTNCYYFETAATPINTPSNMTVSSLVEANVTCTGAADGSVSFTFDNFDAGATDVSYEIFNAQSNVSTGFTGSASVNPPAGPVTVSDFATLPPGVYYLLLTEVNGAFNGCTVGSPNFTIDEATNLLAVSAASPENDNCSPNAGIITALAQYGAPPYQFQYLPDTDPAPLATSPGWVGNTSAQVESGDYIVYVMDSNGCIQSAPVSVALDASPEIALSVVDECADEGNFEVLISLTTAGIAPYQLSVNGGPFQHITFNGSNEYTVTGLSSGGPQSIAVRDLNGCTDSENFTIIPPLEFTVLQTVLLDCEPGAAANAELTIEVTSGSGDYDFEIDGPGLADQTRTALTSNPFVWTGASAAGSYQVIVYDNNTSPPNCAQTITVEVPDALLPVFTETHTDVTCNGGSDGSITLIPVDNGIIPLTYTLTPMPGGAVLNGSTFENLPAGTYDVRATATNNCFTDIFSIVIGEPAPVAVPAPVVTEFTCPAGNNPANATISVNTAGITGGSGSYVIYEFINDQGTPSTADDVVLQTGSGTTYTETDLGGGSYIINVYDSAGCVGSTTAVILPFDALTSATAALTAPVSCDPGTDGEITLTVTSTLNDTSRFEYSIDNGTTYQASNVFAGLSAGTHNFLVRHIDTGCIIPTSLTVANPNTFTIDVVKLSDVDCHGSATGAVTFELLDATYAGGFDWEVWDTNGTPVNLADDISVLSGTEATNGPTGAVNLPAGSYYVTITQNNAPACNNREAFSINGPPAPITGNADITPITCAGNDGIIEINGVAGGWGAYQYYVGTVAPSGPGDYVADPAFPNLSPGTYQAWVLDQDGCDQLVQDNLVLADPAPIAGSLQINQENCTNLEGEIEVVGVSGGQGSNYTYQLIRNGIPQGGPQTAALFGGLGAGSYEVLITDQWGCTFTTSATLLYEEMALVGAVVKPIDCSVTPGGEITITVSGGSANLEYTVTYPDLVTTATNATGVFTGLNQPGTYTFVVNDLDTTPNCTEQITMVLDAPTPVTFNSHTIVNVSCNGLSDGSVRVNLQPTAAGINDNPSYTFNLYDSGGTLIAGPSTNPLFSGLAAGTYEVEAVSGRQCALREPVVISEPAILDVTASATDFACNASNGVTQAIITATGSGGTAPYQYSINGVNFFTNNTFPVNDTGASQIITVHVRDANGCTEVTNVTLEPLNVFTATVTENTALSCAGPGEILISVADDGNPANTYAFELLPVGNPNGTFISSPSNTEALFEVSQVGSYTFRITDTTTGCYVFTAPYEIAPFDLITASAAIVSPVVCFGDTSGSMAITVNGYSGNYSYELFGLSGISTGITGTANTATNPHTITGLSGGNYYVRITQTDYPFCSENTNVVGIASPDMPLTAAITEVAGVTCTNDLGEILIDPSGGYLPYDIVLTNTTTAQVYPANNVNARLFSGLSAGDYTVVITDANGCVLNDVLTLTEPLPITADITATPTTLECYGDQNAVVSAINVTGGRGTYQFRLNYYDASGTTLLFSSGAQMSPVFAGLGEGVYSISVSDGWNCDVETTQVTIVEPTDVMSNLIALNAMTCTTQAQIRLTASGGTGPYTFSTDNITFLPMAGGNTHTFTVNAGVFQYYVRDSFGCEANISNQVSIEAVPPLTLNIDDSAAMINCTGESTGSLVAQAFGGLGNYSYELYGDAALTSLLAGPQPGRTFNNLGAGSYYVRVTSGDCEEVSEEIVIEEPVPLQTDLAESVNVTCAGENDGAILVEVSGGTGEILYAISPNLNQFDDNNVFTDLGPGVYDVIAQDANGCFLTFQFTITQPSPMQIVSTVLPEVCAGSEDGSISLNISGGTPPYRTAFNSNDISDFVIGQTSFTDLAAGTYVVFIRDAAGCETNVIAEVTPGVNLNATAVPVYECTGSMPENSVSLTLEDPSVSGSVMYALDSTDPEDMQLTADFSNLSPGSHYITISHENGCINTVDFEVESFEPLTLALQQERINEITAIATGGLPPYTFYFNEENNGEDNTWYIRMTGTYTVRVVDQNGCEASAEIFMEFIDIEIPNFFTPDGDGINDGWIPRNIEQFPEILIKVFDRYGRVVAHVTSSQAWDGMYKSSELPTGDYWYIIQLNGEQDDREFVGHFTLYR